MICSKEQQFLMMRLVEDSERVIRSVKRMVETGEDAPYLGVSRCLLNESIQRAKFALEVER